MRQLIGSGPAIAESLPAAFGLLIARQGQINSALLDAVNIGDETAAIASLVGALGGAWQGTAAFPAHYLTTVEQANNFDLRDLAQRLTALAERMA
ncbi:hypothetical protein SDC9_182591 [bioreactor metagenome]|uniref:ADP-ribosyl-[dinitrogen reductase] hydrolase n=1 Tax=bioreactor metagenome TaxID=1076179 RepID=A0A645H9A6_9ZZZZ